jgi:hypothetical protein
MLVLVVMIFIDVDTCNISFVDGNTCHFFLQVLIPSYIYNVLQCDHLKQHLYCMYFVVYFVSIVYIL